MHTLTSGKVSLSLTVFCVSAARSTCLVSLLLCVSAARGTYLVSLLLCVSAARGTYLASLLLCVSAARSTCHCTFSPQTWPPLHGKYPEITSTQSL